MHCNTLQRTLGSPMLLPGSVRQEMIETPTVARWLIVSSRHGASLDAVYQVIRHTDDVSGRWLVTGEGMRWGDQAVAEGKEAPVLRCSA